MLNKSDINNDEIDLSSIFNYLYKASKFLYLKKYILLIFLIPLSVIFNIYISSYNANLDKVMNGKIMIIPPSPQMENDMLAQKTDLDQPNISKFYLSIVTNKVHFQNFLDKFSINNKILEIKVNYKIPLFEEISEINKKPSSPRLFIDLYLHSEFFNDNKVNINDLVANFNNYYESIFESDLKTYIINELNLINSEDELELKAMDNVIFKLNNPNLNNEQTRLDEFYNSTITLLASADSTNLFMLMTEMERVALKINKTNELISKVKSNKYSRLLGQKYISFEDKTDYFNKIKVIPLFIFVLFIFISFLLLSLNKKKIK